MIYYVTIGSNDLERSIEFYDAVLATLGAKRQWFEHGYAAYGKAAEELDVFLCKPFDGNAASVGNGMMVALAASSRAAVRAFHAVALAAGGTCEGAPGLREYAPDFYAAYVRDTEGNKLAAVSRTAEE